MLAKKTAKDQITLPKKIASQFPDVDYFNISVEDHRIILEPVIPNQADQVRAKLEALDLSEQDITDAIQWSRRWEV